MNSYHHAFRAHAFRAIALICFATTHCGADGPSAIEPLVRVVDLDVGESTKVMLCDGTLANVKLLELHETRDEVCGAVRKATVTVEVNGTQGKLVSATYHRPQVIGRVQVDCAVTQGYNKNGTPSFWGLDKAARLRLWPAKPGTGEFVLGQRNA